MSQISIPSIPVSSLLDRTIRALANADANSAAEALAECASAAVPVSPEELSRALTQQAVLEKMLEQTRRNLRVLRGEEDDFHYGRRRGRNS
jgi:hypothetical protein